ncbi:MAG: PASTA domain-containing protein, partial [Gemmatimonadales bacterium]
MGLFWAVAVARLVQVQVLEHGRASELADRQAQSWVTIPASRGRILDCNGTILATNEPFVSFAAVPKEWKSKKDRNRAAQRLASVCGGTQGEWLKRFGGSPEFIWVKRDADPGTAARILSWDDDAIFQREEPGRRYPAGSVARELLGRVDIDNRGQSGLEQAFDSVLADRPGKGRARGDATRRMVIDPLPAALAADGCDVVLTIDLRWQEIAEQELRRVVRSKGARGGGAIFMTPQGDIRALAYYANDSLDSEAGRLSPRCRPVTDLFEPGSTFKSFMAAALLTEHVVQLTDSIYADSGISRFDNRWIRDSKPHLWLTFAQSLIVSSNIAFGKWAQRLEGDQLYRWTHDFGFGESVRLGLAAEPSGLIPNPRRWTVLAKAQLAMGHSLAATPLQVVTAFCAFANGGGLFRPYVMRAVIDPEGDTVMTGRPHKIRHPISSEIVETVGELLARVVSEGTAKYAQSKAITLAGKTGTAQKVKEDGTGYYKNRYIASFVGFFPADKPQVVGIVYLDEPHGVIPDGGMTAAPAFRNIAERFAAMDPELLDYPVLAETGELPAPRPDPIAVEGRVPDFEGLPLSNAVVFASQQGFSVWTSGSGCVVAQSPAEGTLLAAGGVVRLKARTTQPVSTAVTRGSL